MAVLDLVRLDVIFAIGDPPTQLEEPRTFSGPAPALKSTGAHAPAAGELVLVQVLDTHKLLLGLLRKTEGIIASS
jgi:hypothetical protein